MSNYIIVDTGIIPPEPAPVVNTRLLTHIQFRRLFTTPERQLADELEVTFETSTELSVEHKRTLRSGYKDFNAASEVDLDDHGIPEMLALYAALGIITPERINEILGIEATEVVTPPTEEVPAK